MPLWPEALCVRVVHLSHSGERDISGRFGGNFINEINRFWGSKVKVAATLRPFSSHERNISGTPGGYFNYTYQKLKDELRM